VRGFDSDTASVEAARRNAPAGVSDRVMFDDADVTQANAQNGYDPAFPGEAGFERWTFCRSIIPSFICPASRVIGFGNAGAAGAARHARGDGARPAREPVAAIRPFSRGGPHLNFSAGAGRRVAPVARDQMRKTCSVSSADGP
jgi:hypothetical protein